MASPALRTVLAASCAALALAGCGEPQSAAKPATGYGVPVAEFVDDMPLAPAGEALPVGRPAQVSTRVLGEDGYGWAERAYALDRAFYDVPPDYEFSYGGTEPWAWESQDRWTMYAEPIESGYRTYYYEPGTTYPYFVRDDAYGYGYDQRGGLVALYSLAGALLPVSARDQRADLAGRYWTRAHEMRRAADRAQRAPVDQPRWKARAPGLSRSQQPWFQAAERQEDWRKYRDVRRDRDQRRFAGERQRREAEAKRRDRQPAPQREAARVQPEMREEQAARVASEGRGRDLAKERNRLRAEQELGRRQAKQDKAESRLREESEARQRQSAQQQTRREQRPNAEPARPQRQDAEPRARQARDRSGEGRREQAQAAPSPPPQQVRQERREAPRERPQQQARKQDQGARDAGRAARDAGAKEQGRKADGPGKGGDHGRRGDGQRGEGRKD